MNRNIHVLGFLLSFLPVFCMGQSANPDARANVGSVSGIVVCQDNGQPLDKVTVSLRPVNNQILASVVDSESVQQAWVGYVDRSFETESDMSGHFAFAGVPSGGYTVQADKSGYVREHPNVSSGAPVTVRAGEADELTVPLHRAGVIVGRVVDEDGEPIAQVYVQALRYQYSDGKRILATEGQAQTNDLGEYRIYGLAPQKYYVRANSLGDRHPLRRGEQLRGGKGNGFLYPAVFYPGSGTPETALRIDVKSGDEQHADLTLVPARAFRVSARVTGAPRSERANTWLMLSNLETDQRVGGLADPAGDSSFVFESVLPGQYWLLASSSVPDVEGESSVEKTGHIQVSVTSADVAGITVPLEVSSSVTLHARLKIDSRPSAPVDVSRLNIGFDVDDTNGPQANFRRNPIDTSNVEEDGTFTVTVEGAVGVVQPRITTNAPGFEDYYTKSLTVGGRSVTDAGIMAADFSVGRTLEIVLSPLGARVEGLVFDADKKPRPGVLVACVPEGIARARHELYITDTTNQQGHYVLRGLRPGSYKLYAFDEIDPGAIYSSEFLKPFEDLGESIEVKEKDTLNKPLQVLHQTED
jgi:hypothetical protein